MAGYSPWGCQRVRHNLATKQQTKNNNQLVNCHYLPPKLQLAMNNHQKENVGLHQKKIPHVQGQRRSPSKTVSSGAAAARCWSNFEEIPHIQGQRRSPKKMVGGAKSSLESSPIPARDAQRAQMNLAHQDPETPQRLSQNCV